MSQHIAVIPCSLTVDNARLGIHSAHRDGKPILELMLSADGADTGYLPMTAQEAIEAGAAMFGFGLAAIRVREADEFVRDVRQLMQKWMPNMTAVAKDVT